MYFEWIEPNEEDERFVDAPDSDTEPDPYFEGMSWNQIVEDLDDYEYEARWYEEEWRRLQAKGF